MIHREHVLEYVTHLERQCMILDSVAALAIGLAHERREEIERLQERIEALSGEKIDGPEVQDARYSDEEADASNTKTGR